MDAKVWRVYENEPVLGAPRFNLSKGTPSTVGPPKDHCAPCDVSPWGSITFRSCVMTSKPAQATSPRTFREHVKGLDTHKQRRLRNLVTMTNMMEARLCRHLLLGLPCKIATDGSMQQDKRSSFAWTMRLKRTNALISEQSAQRSGPVDGDPAQNSSTRADLFGLALVMLFLQEFIEFHSISTAPPHT